MFGFATFRQHCAAGFRKYKLLKDPDGYLGERKNRDGEAMGNFGRMTSVKDLRPDYALINLIKHAVKLNDEGIKIAKKKLPEKKELFAPEELPAVLASDKKAIATFGKFLNSQKREYSEWISVAKTEATKNKRIATALDRMAQDKPRHWKNIREE